MYTPLFIKSNYSFLKSLIKIDDLIKKCLDYGIKSVALTDENMISTMMFFKKCKENNIKPIIGLSTLYKDKYINLYAKNYDGYKYLIKVNLNKKIDYDELKNNKDNIVIIVPFLSIDLYNELSVLDAYLGIGSKEEEKEAEKLTKNIVFSNEVLYLNKSDSSYYKYAIMLKSKKNIRDDIEFKDSNNYLMRLEDIDVKKEYLDNTNKIASMCEVDIENHERLIPEYDNKQNVSSDEYLKKLSITGLSIRLDNKVTDKYKNRLLYELDVIKKMGFSDYFLIVYDYIRYAKKKNILIGPGRGSAGGSLVAYSLGIIDFDPMKYDLLFERFLNPARVTMPDIDVDFPDEYRDEVKEYVKEKYGEKKVAGVIAVGSLKAKAVLDDVGKVLLIEQDKVSRLKAFITKPKDKLKDIYKNNEDFRNIVDNDDRLTKLYKVSLMFEDFPRNTTVHASGVIISKKDLDEVIPLEYEDNKLISSFEGGYLEDLGLLKMDFLGNANLTMIMNIMKKIKEEENVDIDFLNIPLDDKETLECFYNVDTNGIFQFDSDVMKNLLSRLKVESFDDIVAAISLVRPGPDTNTYIDRRNKNTKINYINKDVERVLSSTYGVLVYQEQVMEIARCIGGFTMSEADNLRRAMSKKKKDVLSSWEEKFIDGGLKNGYDYEYVKKMYDDILAFSEYGFNKSHAVAYAVIAYKMAYFKVHYSKYFYLCLLSMIIGEEKETSSIIKEAKKKGVEFLLPDINKSKEAFTVEGNAVRFPLSNIKNIGVNTAIEIIKVRGDGFADIYDAFIKLNEAGINKKVLESLIYAGAFSSFGYNKNTIISNLDNLLTYAYIAKGIESDIIEHPEIEIKEEFDKNTLMNYEKNLFGFYLTHHPVSIYKDNFKVVDLNRIKDYFGKTVDTLILVDKIKTHRDKNNNLMAFITGSDETDEIEYIFFSSVFSTIDTVKRGDIILVRGKVEKKTKYQIVAEKSKIVS